ncbi:MAG: hypothetical protein IJQ56_07825 [Synergistaceae bacterium]|nr:hypothetical protein [Synergistaceae bacterium]
MSENYKFFENIRCEFYPCHKGLHNLNCLFCYCPFYHDMNCGGDFKILSNGCKDCSACVYPHIRENYDEIIRRLNPC